MSIGVGTWKIILAAQVGSFDAYVYGTRGLGARFGTYQTELGSVTEPGASPDLIAVGAYVSRIRWPSAGRGDQPITGYLGGSEVGTLAYFSGLGPNRKNVLKPELTPPGRWIMASMSESAWPLDEDLSMYQSPVGSNPLLMVAPDSIHAVSQGTSFATPHVAGLCALLLEADPALSHAEIKAILTETAAGDSLAAGLPNNYWGYGRANAVEAVRRVLGLSADSLVLTGCLSPTDTLPADSLVFSVTADFTASAQVLRSFVLSIDWPEDFLYMEKLPDSLGARDELSMSFDTGSLGTGKLGVSGYSVAGVAARDTILSLVLRPRLAVPVDSVSVALELTELRGDLLPVELEEAVVLHQAPTASLAPAVCLITGDVDTNGRVDIFDLLAMLRRLSDPEELPTACADLDGNSQVNIFDLLELLQVISSH